MDVRYRHNELRLEASGARLSIDSAPSNAEVVRVLRGAQVRELKPGESATFDLERAEA